MNKNESITTMSLKGIKVVDNKLDLLIVLYYMYIFP